MPSFGPRDIKRILAVTDGLRLHRMSVRVPLRPEGAGVVRLVGTTLEVVPPAEGDFEEWLARLPAELARLDLARVPKTP